MKKLIILIGVSFIFSGCVYVPRIVTPIAPSTNYRDMQEVILISCFEREFQTNHYNGVSSRPWIKKEKKVISVVEATDTGQRFEMYGCYGNIGDRFRISY